MALIAILDDDESLRILLKDFVTTIGHEAVEFGSGPDFLKYVDDHANPLPAVLILDVMMPVMDGYTVYSHLQQNERERRISIVVLTAKGQTRNLFEHSPQVASFLMKPVKLAVFRQAVEKALGPQPAA